MGGDGHTVNAICLTTLITSADIKKSKQTKPPYFSSHICPACSENCKINIYYGHSGKVLVQYLINQRCHKISGLIMRVLAFSRVRNTSFYEDKHFVSSTGKKLDLIDKTLEKIREQF